MAESIERGACPRCGKPAPLAGRVCPHCKGSLLVDVVLAAAPSDGRARYQAARSLSTLGPGAPAFSAAQQAMAIPGAVIVSGVTRDLAAKILEALAEHGGRGRTTPAVEEGAAAGEAPGGGVSSFLVVVILLAVAGFALYAWTRHLGGEEGIELPTGAARTVEGPLLSSRQLAEQATAATISLHCRSSFGSGFFVARELVLTNAHLLCPPGDPLRAVSANGQESPATVERRDDWLDLAVVRVPGATVQPLPLGDATDLRTGDRVLFAGTPGGLGVTVREGRVSHQARSIFGVAFLPVGAELSPGSSGGPLLDHHGRVVGIISARLASAEGLGFALPIDYAYFGNPALLPLPRLAAPDEGSWNLLLAEVATADRTEVQKAQKETGPTALVGIVAPPGQGLVAVLARHAMSTPRSEPASFIFRGNGRILCRVKAVAQRWRKAAEDTGDSGDADHSRYLQWATKNALRQDVFLGFATLDVQSCPVDEMGGAALVLEGSDETSDRIGV
jgi:serine protease Do